MRSLCLATLLLIALGSLSAPAQAGDHWGFSFHSYAPAVPYYVPVPPPPPVYAYPAYPAPWVGYHRHYHGHHHHYVRPLPPPPRYWAPPPRSSVSLFLGF